MPAPSLDDKRTANGRLKMMLVLLVCAAPVIASYLTYFVIRPEGRTNYSELVQPQRPIPVDLPLVDVQGQSVSPASLKGQWLLVAVAGGACDEGCEKKLWLQRQLREALGREKDRLDKVWLVHDGVPARAQAVQAMQAAGAATVLVLPQAALAKWLEPAPGQRLEDHFYIVDPLGNWMMRVPPNPDAARLKRDLDKLLRASASWDTVGR
ncbi:hypothetical protein LRS03_12535 [Rhizobacter sp. J219]|nr:hypothetical protein [Rhizobacter sp. J219]MCR5883636.1 hypothetical protein [Rhizobacter sp. J219]